eukprot:1275787-Pleurochrysis_carterae.AAC.2
MCTLTVRVDGAPKSCCLLGMRLRYSPFVRRTYADETFSRAQPPPDANNRGVQRLDAADGRDGALVRTPLL